MLFKFKSHAASDLIMFEADARRLLKIMIGDDPVKGILQVHALPKAIQALETAVAQSEAEQREKAQKSATEISGQDDEPVALSAVSLSQRVTPMLKMLKRSLSEESDVVWGV
jgi:hypothetical protein